MARGCYPVPIRHGEDRSHAVPPDQKQVYQQDQDGLPGRRAGHTRRQLRDGILSTVQASKGTISGPWYNDTSPYFLNAFMGTDTASQPNAGTAPTVYLHSFTLADTPPSLTLFKSYDAAAYYFAYSVVEKVVFKFTADGKLLEADFDTQDQYGIKVSSPPTPSFSGLLPFARATCRPFRSTLRPPTTSKRCRSR